MATVTVKVINFRHGVKHVKRMGGVYDEHSRTWTIPSDRPELGNLAAYGLELVQASGGMDIGSDHIADDYAIETGNNLQDAMEDEHSDL